MILQKQKNKKFPLKYQFVPKIMSCLQLIQVLND